MKYSSIGAAGADLYPAEEVKLRPLERALVPTGEYINIPNGMCGLVVPRSGNAYRAGLTVLNSPGLIDPDYEGEVKVLLINLGHEMIFIKKDVAIAQLVVVPFERLPCDVVTNKRGDNGFGSSGVINASTND